MVQYCIVPGCKNNALIPGMRFHCFPKSPKLKKKWELRIKRDTRYNKPISSSMRVCSEHFVESDYRETYRKEKRFLKSDAIPSVFPFNLPKSKPRRILHRITQSSIPQENASVQIDEEINENQIIVEQNNEESLEVSGSVSEENLTVQIQEENDLYVVNEGCVNINMAVSEENTSVEIEGEIDEHNNEESLKFCGTVSEENVSLETGEDELYLINEDKCNKEYLEVSMTVSEENESVEIENDSYLISEDQYNEEYLQISMAVSEVNASAEIQENDLVNEEQFNENCLEDGIVERSNKLLEERIKKLEEELAAVKSENNTLHCLVADLTTLNNLSKRPPNFSFNTIKKNAKSFSYYTGFHNVQSFQALKSFLTSADIKLPSKALSFDDQLFLTLCKLRQGFENYDLSVRFCVSPKTVSNIFIHWINIMYCRLGSLDLWPSREIIFKTAPQQFKELYPRTVVILDCTELKIEVPSDFVLQSQTFSNYKSANTMKCLIGCDPNAAIIFVSQLFTGSMSDKQICEDSNLFNLLRSKLLCGDIVEGDSIMADKGFGIKNELANLKLEWNIPPFALSEQFSAEEVFETRKIASARIHVERAIRRVKIYKIFKHFPLTFLPHLNQAWTVCCILANFEHKYKK